MSDMDLSPRIRWNHRYKNPQYWKSSPRKLLVDYCALLPKNGKALDIAMGVGANAGFLVSRGLDVVGIDISTAGVLKAKREFPAVQALIGNLEEISFPQSYFDCILNFYYLQRQPWIPFDQIIKPGGMIFMETLLIDQLEIKPGINPKNLLERSELIRYFLDWKIIYYYEGWLAGENGSKKAVAQLIARKRGEQMEKYVSVYTASGMLQAETIRLFLQSFDIPCRLSQESAGAVYGLTVGELGAVEVMVPIDSAQSASNLLLEMEKGKFEDSDEVEEDEEANIL